MTIEPHARVITLGVEDMNRAKDSTVPHEANLSYRDVLWNRHVARLLLGDLFANAGTGMLMVAMPVQTLSIHGRVPKAIAIGLVGAAPFVLSTILALTIGLGRIRMPPRSLLIADCALRSLTFATLGILPAPLAWASCGVR